VESSFPKTTNKDMAGVFFNMATLLRVQGNANPFRTAAYERGARALLGLDRQASAHLEVADRVPFRRRQRIGKRLQAKIREMAQTGELEQYGALIAQAAPHLSGLMSVPGIGPKTAERVYQTLHVSSAHDLIRAARDNRLLRVRGFGPKRTAFLAGLPLPGEAVETAQGVLFDLAAEAP
jgi:DNA polymerase (family 10)